MAMCPVCQAEIEITSQHHGTLFTCPHCNGVFFVDWSGLPEATTPNPPEESLPVAEVNEGVGISFPPVPHFTVSEGGDGSSSEDSGESFFGESAEAPPFQGESWAPSENQKLDSEETTLSGDVSRDERDSADLSEIADFGNADLAQAAFNYTLIVSGIDSGRIREQIQEAITDEKFGWNVLQVMAQIKDGVLTIKSLSPVKASILMQRVKYLPVKVSWRQDVLSSTV